MFWLMSTEYYVVLCTCPDDRTARDVAAALVEEQAAACVNIVPGLRSVYRWQGAVEEDEELLLLIKTTAASYPAVERIIRARHPYDVPEIIAASLAAGLPAYLSWIGESC